MNNPIEMYFSEIEDPRKGWNVLCPLEEVLLVAMVSFLVGGEGIEDMKEMGEVWLEEFRKQWKGLESIAMVESWCTRNGKDTYERRFYITSFKPDAKKWPISSGDIGASKTTSTGCSISTSMTTPARLEITTLQETLPYSSA